MTNIFPGKASFMATNMIPNTTAGITASSQATGAVSRPQKEGSGSASLTITGTFTGTDAVDFYIEIEATGEIGVATFKWSNDGGVTFAATGVTTLTTAILLQNGVSVEWVQGSGNDVVIADVWRFKGYLPYGRAKVLDRDRDTEWRSTGVTTESLTFDLGSSKTPTVLVILDHNLSSSGSVRLQGSTVSNFASLVSNYAVPWSTGSILYFLGAPLGAARYWRIQLSNVGNTDAYLRISNVFLGTYSRLGRTFSLGDIRGKARVGQRSQMLSGRFYGAVNAMVHGFDLSWIRLDQTDRDTLITVFDALVSLSDRTVSPVFFSPQDTDLSQIYLCEWQDGQVVATSETDAPERFTVPVKLLEIPRTVDTS